MRKTYNKGYKLLEERVDGNRAIAEFMGGEFYADLPTCLKNRVGPPGNRIRRVTELKYHTSWEWLMPVFEKISTLRYPNYWNGKKPDDANPFEDCAHPRTFGMRDEEGNYMVRLNANTLHAHSTWIGAAWLAVVDFINWYNEENKK